MPSRDQRLVLSVDTSLYPPSPLAHQYPRFGPLSPLRPGNLNQQILTLGTNHREQVASGIFDYRVDQFQAGG